FTVGALGVFHVLAVGRQRDQGAPDVAVGSVIGSNIFNVLVILGLAALIIPLRVSRQLVRLGRQPAGLR
ncbi:hypothetical protein SB772_43570, partial [Paraburkholderia sp. SIMBA_030]